MKMFGNLTQDGLEEAGDRIGGGGVVDSGVYDGTVKLAYAGKAQSSNAQSITIHLDLGGREYRETLWITNRNGENFWLDKQDPTKKNPLPGFTTIDDLCLLTTGYSLSEQTVEEKVVKLYDFETKKDLPQSVQVLTTLIGKPISAAILKQTVDKNKKDANGVYQPTGETRDENVVDKFFHAETGRTVTEVKQGMATASFKEKWADKNTGTVRNRAKGAPGNTGTPGAPAAPAANQAPATSIFGS